VKPTVVPDRELRVPISGEKTELGPSAPHVAASLEARHPDQTFRHFAGCQRDSETHGMPFDSRVDLIVRT
jgi:hypothetical protein